MKTFTTPLNGRLVRRKEVLQIAGISNSQLYDMLAAGTFPRPVKLNPPDGRAIAWRGDDITAWMESLPSTKAA